MKNHRPSNRELKQEEAYTRKFLSKWSQYCVRDNVLYRKIQIQGQEVFQLVLSQVLKGFVLNRCMMQLVISGLREL